MKLQSTTAIAHVVDLTTGHLREVPVALYRTTPEGSFVDVNEAMVELMGYPDKETLLATPASALDSDPSLHDLYRRRLLRDGVLVGFEKEARHYSGRRFWVRDNARLEVEQAEGAFCFAGALVDITAERRAIEALEESEERFRTLFQRSPIAMWEEDFSALEAWLERLREAGVTDLRAYLLSRPWEVRRGIRLIRVVDVNPAGIALLGATSKEQIIGTISDSTVAPETEAAFVETMVAVWDGKTRLEVDIVGTTITGERMECIMHWVAAPGGDPGDLSRVVLSLTDVTALRRSEARLRDQVRSKDQLVAAVSHQLRTPLTSVIGFAEELLGRWSELDPDEGLAYVSMISEQGTELSHIVEDLMVAATGDIRPLAIKLQTLDLREQVSDVTNGLPVDRAKGLRIHGNTTMAIGDPARIRQILRNLLDNAFRHGGRNVEAVVESRHESASVAVRDDGPGIPQGHIDQAFERYQVIEPGTATGVGTKGIGLAISRDLARRMGGELTYRRLRGVTTFELFLPIPNASPDI